MGLNQQVQIPRRPRQWKSYNLLNGIRTELEQLRNGSKESSDIFGKLVDSSVRLVGYYGRSCEEKGYRNGYEPKRVKTAEGSVEVKMPRVRGTQPFKSAFLSKLEQTSPELKRLVMEMYSRGLSTRDIEEMLSDEKSGELFCQQGGSERAERGAVGRVPELNQM